MLLDADPARAFLPYPAAPVRHAETGPLAGLTFGVKDLIDVAGYPTGAGSPHVLALSGIKVRTAPVVQRLLDAGAAFVGKTHSDELAFSMTGKNVHFGTPMNGAAPERVPGGSSSGSASAVSNGLCDFALGTDTGGSVRAPASHCGLFGIRPTHGRVSLERCLDLAPSFDTCGFLARDPLTFMRVGEVVLEADLNPLSDTPRLLVAADTLATLDRDVRAVLAPLVQSMERLLGEARFVEAATEGFEPLYDAFRHLQAHEAWQTDGDLIERYWIPLGPSTAERFAFGRSVTEAQVAEAAIVRKRFGERFLDLLGPDGVLLLPTMPDVAPLLSDNEDELELYRSQAVKLLCLAGLSGCPQISMPLTGRLGAPLGLSILGPPGSDLSLVRLAVRIAREHA